VPELQDAGLVDRRLTRPVALVAMDFESLVPPSVRTAIRERVRPQTAARLRAWLKGYPTPRWGNLRRLTPFSSNYGFERGTPIDRYYLHRFLDEHRHLITGVVLEIQAAMYTREYGQHVITSETLDIDEQHQPTYRCDLAQSLPIVPSDRFDCFLLPNTLGCLRDLEGSLTHALRVVRPGGVILASMAGLVPLTDGESDYWHLSGAGWREITTRVWPGCDVAVAQHGNVLAAVAALLGLAAEELTPQELDVIDPRYPVLVTVRCVRPLAQA
jgi:hypothetical protein